MIFLDHGEGNIFETSFTDIATVNRNRLQKFSKAHSFKVFEFPKRALCISLKQHIE